MGTGVGEAMLIGAVTGAGTSAITGGDPLKGALFGAAGGAAFGGAAGAAGGGSSGAAAGTTAGTTGTAAGATGTAAGTSASALPTAIDPTITMAGTPGVPGDVSYLSSFTGPMDGTTTNLIDYGEAAGTMTNPAGSGVSQGLPAQTDFQRAVSDLTGMDIRPSVPNVSGSADDARQAQKYFPNISNLYAKYPVAGPAGAGAFTSAMFNKPPGPDEEEDEYRGPLSDFSYSRSGYTPYRAASGGLMDTEPARRMAGGGLGSYSDGGQTLQGPGDGMSDSIPATIGGAQPARLADGEFVVPADVVSGIGNGSTDAGARQLYSMMDKVREARTGRTRQAPEINPRRMMPT